MIFSPNKDIAKKEVVDLEDIQNRLRTTITSMVLSGSSKEEIESVLNSLIYGYLKKIKVEDITYKRQIEQSLLNLAQHQYFELTNNMKEINTSFIKSMGGSYSIDLTAENASVNLTQDKFRNFITRNKDIGTPLIDRYEQLVRDQLKVLANQPAKVVTYNRNEKKISYTMSARNLAEMKVRYDANVEDVNKEKEKGTKFVWISSHSNCSPRCAPFQGKLYSLDGTSGTIAGHKYIPIEVAQRGKNGDGNGCTNGYNCRHYIIPTSEEELQKGQQAPVNYNNVTIKKEQEIDAKQRAYENQIRKLKKEESNLRAGGFSDEAKKLNQRWKILEKRYQIYSLQNHRSFSRWRTQVSKDEKIDFSLFEKVEKSDIINSTFTPASSIEEAQEYAKSILGKKNINYDGINVNVANSANEAIKKGLDYCPKINNKLQSIGSGQKINKSFKKELEVAFYKYYQKNYPGKSNEWYGMQSTYAVNKTIKPINNHTYAFARVVQKFDPIIDNVTEKYSGIFVNETFGKNSDKMIKSLQKDVASGFHPIGCDTIKSVFDHEIGHQIDYALDLRNKSDIMNMWDSLSKEEISKGLSKYATTNIKEFIAEGYSEYVNNNNPRELAKRIGEIIEKEARKNGK